MFSCGFLIGSNGRGVLDEETLAQFFKEWKLSVLPLLLLCLLTLPSSAQNSQCIFRGTVRIDGQIPSGTVQIELLKSNFSFVRLATYTASSGTYTVNAFASDGFQNGDRVLFRVLHTTASFIARTRGEDPIFIGTELPNPPDSASLRDVDLFNNHSPLSFHLLAPANGSFIQLEASHPPITFEWESSADPDSGDTLWYFFRLYGSGIDTTVELLENPLVALEIMNHLLPSHTYWWSASVFDGMDVTPSADTFTFVTSDSVLSVRKKDEILDGFRLYQNYPNPFNSTTTIRFRLHVGGSTSLMVYDVFGREAAMLVNEQMPAGEHEVEWNAEKFSSGVYFYRLRTPLFIEMKKLLLLK
jgi:hypothetical protein